MAGPTSVGPQQAPSVRDAAKEGTRSARNRQKGVVTSSTIGGGRGCSIFVPVLGGNGPKTAPTGALPGTDLTNPLVKCDEFEASLPTM